MATQQEVHAKIKSVVEDRLKAALSRVDNVPADPPFQGIGNDINYAYYWAERAFALAEQLDERLGELGYPQ
jgi:hypothetical protein